MQDELLLCEHLRLQVQRPQRRRHLGDKTKPFLTNWTIHLSDGQTAVTDAEGYYNFANLPDGTYTVTEEVVAGWAQTAPIGGSYTVTLLPGQSTNGLAFGNTTTNFAVISGVKFNDLNHNGKWDSGEPVLTNWVIVLFQSGHVIASTTTDTNGTYQFKVPPGYYGVGEFQPTRLAAGSL